jgi:dTMP kinase
MNKRAFIVIEGPDGTGKTVQTELLVSRLKSDGFPVRTISFPRYETPTGAKVKEYLDGKLGSLDKIGAEQASKLYADDRAAGADEIRAWLADGYTVIANRYVASNMAHQGAKLPDEMDRLKFFAWNDNVEYAKNGIPVPDLNIILSVPYEVADKRVVKRGNPKDIHEADPEYLKRAHNVYREIARLFPQKFKRVDCTDGERELSPAEVHEHIWNIVKTNLG